MKFKNEGPAKNALQAAAHDALRLTGAKQVTLTFTAFTSPDIGFGQKPDGGFGVDGDIRFWTEAEVTDIKTSAESVARLTKELDDLIAAVATRDIEINRLKTAKEQAKPETFVEGTDDYVQEAPAEQFAGTEPSADAAPASESPVRKSGRRQAKPV